MTMTARRQIPLVLASLVLAGCSLQHPYSPQATASRSSTAADAGDPPPERAGTIPPVAQAAQQALAPGAAQPTPQAALARYASLAVDWSWRNLPAVQRRLEAISLGQARAQAAQAAAQAAPNTTHQQDRIANTGRPVAIAPGQASAAGWWVIVTSEQTTGQGPYADLPPSLHITYAQLAHVCGGWLVTRWQPQN